MNHSLMLKSLMLVGFLFACETVVAQDAAVPVGEVDDAPMIDPAVAKFAEQLHPIAPAEEQKQISGETKELFDKMIASAEASSEVFRTLSVEQMNFKPSNGSHTPRWNVEHMAGVQLMFFSQIYHELDPQIPVLKIMPKQMPADYTYRHADWTGAMEADWIKVVNDFCLRYSYLLANADLDAKPPATFWPTYRALLEKMEDHYREHTANVEKKFKLEGWPKG